MQIHPLMPEAARFSRDEAIRRLMDDSNRTENEQNVLDRLADENGLAIVVADENSSVVSASNNNSMCRALYRSEEFAPRPVVDERWRPRSVAWPSGFPGSQCPPARRTSPGRWVTVVRPTKQFRCLSRWATKADRSPGIAVAWPSADSP